jgi:hypothetical protein
MSIWFSRLSEKDWKEIRETGYNNLSPGEKNAIRKWASNIQEKVPGVGPKESMMIACAAAMYLVQEEGASLVHDGEDITVAL